MLRPVFHLSVIVLNVFTLWYDQKYVDYPFSAEGYSKMVFKGRLTFLTNWCFILQTLYFAVSFLNDIFGTNAPAPKKTPLIRSIKDSLYGLAFTIALFVSVAFWGMYAVKKELVIPPEIERVFPVWFNHALHTSTSISILIELLATNIVYPSRKVGMFLTMTYSISYIVWMHILHARFGNWAYPIFGVLNLPQRIAYLATTIVITVGLYILGEKLNNAVNKESNVQHGKDRARKVK